MAYGRDGARIPRGEGGENKKNFASETTKCMKTQGELTKCHDKKAKIRRKSGLFFGHSRQSDTNFARNCTFRGVISSDRGLRKTLVMRKGGEPTLGSADGAFAGVDRETREGGWLRFAGLGK